MPEAEAFRVLDGYAVAGAPTPELRRSSWRSSRS